MRGIKPTRKQKERIKAHRLDYNNWLVLKEEGETLTIIHKQTGTTRTLKFQQVQRKRKGGNNGKNVFCSLRRNEGN